MSFFLELYIPHCFEASTKDKRQKKNYHCTKLENHKKNQSSLFFCSCFQLKSVVCVANDKRSSFVYTLWILTLFTILIQCRLIFFMYVYIGQMNDLKLLKIPSIKLYEKKNKQKKNPCRKHSTPFVFDNKWRQMKKKNNHAQKLHTSFIAFDNKTGR